MSLLLLDKDEKVIEIIPTSDIYDLWRNDGINKIDILEGSLKLTKEYREKLKEATFTAVRDKVDRNKFHMYRLITKRSTNTEIIIKGLQIAFDELKVFGYIKDLRPQNRRVNLVMDQLLGGSGWTTGFIDSRLPNVTTNFYYMSRLEAVQKLTEVIGAELEFYVSISGNEVVGKFVDVHYQIGEDNGKRFTYGTNAVEIIAEEDLTELYTAFVGRGRGEQVSDGTDSDTGQAGYGRKITFEDIEWKKSDGDPVDKPLGQEFVEIPEATRMYSKEGKPRIDIREYDIEEDKELLLRTTYYDLVNYVRPKVQFRTTVSEFGDVNKGDIVTITRYDLGIQYQARVFDIRRNYINNDLTEIDIGDKLLKTTAERQRDLKREFERENEDTNKRLENVWNVAADGTRVNYGMEEPDVKRVDDIWYEVYDDGKVRLRIWDGDDWIIRASDIYGKELEGKIGEIEDRVEEVDSKAQETIDDINQVVSDNGFTTLEGLFASKISGEEAETMFYQEAEAIGLVYMEDGIQKAIIGIQDGLPYIKGEHVILDGDTIVDGTFEVTESMLAPEAVIGQLQATGIDASEIDVINLTVDSITGGDLDLAKGFRITHNGNPVLDIDGSTGEVTANFSRLQINFDDVATQKDLEEIELTPGKDGKTAYEIAVENGFEGTEQEWLNSLKGEDGGPGKDATNWEIGEDGFWYKDGTKTDKRAVGIDGEDPDIWTIGDNGNWYKNGVDTGNPSQGPQGDPGEDGISVSSIDEEYYHSDSATSLVGGSWSETRPSWSKDKYIWIRTKTTFSNGEIQRTEPVSLQGYHGDDGEDALPNYTWVKYSLIQNPTSQDMRDNPQGMIYRGVAYNKNNSQESSNPNDYIWEPMYDVEKLEDVENAVDDFRLLITIQDTRNVNYAPSHYKDNFGDYEVTERKINTVIGVPSENTHGVTITRVVDNQVEMTFYSGGEIYTRVGNASNDVWGDWSQTETVEGAQEKVAESFGDSTQYAIDLVGDVETRAKNYVDGLVDPLTTNIETIDDELLRLRADIKANSSEWRQSFSASGGVNEIRNSVGYAELEFWRGTGNVTTVQNQELESYGSGSAFILGSNSMLEQNVVGPSGNRVFSAIVQKDSASSGYIEIIHDDNIEVISLNAGSEQNFVLIEKLYDLVGTNYTIRLVTDIGSEILFTNIMVNQGSERQGWSFAHDEMYGSTFRMNRNGFRVYQLDGTQYTAMTPDEFAGYAIVGGVWQRTFALNGDTTQMRKAYVEEEMRIGGISMIRVQNGPVRGIAFVRSGS